MLFESKQIIRPQPEHINERSVQQTVVTCVPEAITENDDSQGPACESSYRRRRRARDVSAAWADEHDRTERPFFAEAHNERAFGVRHEDVASLVPVWSGTMIKAGKTPLVPRSGQSKVRNWSRGAH